MLCSTVNKKRPQRVLRSNRGVAIFFRHIKKSPYHLNMMRVTVIDRPSSEERVMVTHEGKEVSCYVQGNAWDSPSCEDILQEWSRTPGVNRQVWVNQATTVINDSSLPWHKALAISRIVPKKCQELDMLTPEGLWVAYRLQLKRTRNPSCFRSTRYFVAWKPGSTPPYPVETLHGTTFLLWASEDCPFLSDVKFPKKLSTIAKLDISSVDVTGL